MPANNVIFVRVDYTSAGNQAAVLAAIAGIANVQAVQLQSMPQQ